jgi:hypothetical protein
LVDDARHHSGELLESAFVLSTIGIAPGLTVEQKS